MPRPLQKMANYPRLAQRSPERVVANSDAPKCLACRTPFRGRLFDPEVQLALEGWRRCGPSWLCRECS